MCPVCPQYIKKNYGESPENYSKALRTLEQLRQVSRRCLNLMLCIRLIRRFNGFKGGQAGWNIITLPHSISYLSPCPFGIATKLISLASPERTALTDTPQAKVLSQAVYNNAHVHQFNVNSYSSNKSRQAWRGCLKIRHLRTPPRLQCLNVQVIDRWVRI